MAFRRTGIVKTLVAVLAPHHGKVYDPCCGSGGMFVQSEEFIEAHGGKLGHVAILGQEAHPTTWRLAAMNLAIRGGIDFNLGREPADSFTRDQFPDPLVVAPDHQRPLRRPACRHAGRRRF